MMQNFKQFINEGLNPNYIEVDSRFVENNKDSINADFDRLTAQPYTNTMVFYNQIRGTLERYGMIMPPSATKQFMSTDGELAFKLGEEGLNLYVVFNTHKNSYVDGYVQVVDDVELDHLMSDYEEDMEDEVEEEAEEVEDEEEDDMDDMEEMDTMEKYRKRRDDDSGNTGEY
jgi:DNA primase large subunit